GRRSVLRGVASLPPAPDSAGPERPASSRPREGSVPAGRARRKCSGERAGAWQCEMLTRAESRAAPRPFCQVEFTRGRRGESPMSMTEVSFNLGAGAGPVAARLEQWQREDLGRRFWAKDPTIWA